MRHPVVYTLVYNFVNHRQDRIKLETEVDQKLHNLKKEKYAILGELNALKEKEMGSDDGIQTKAASASASTPSAPSHQDVGSDFMEIVEIKGVS